MSEPSSNYVKQYRRYMNRGECVKCGRKKSEQRRLNTRCDECAKRAVEYNRAYRRAEPTP